MLDFELVSIIMVSALGVVVVLYMLSDGKKKDSGKK